LQVSDRTPVFISSNDTDPGGIPVRKLIFIAFALFALGIAGAAAKPGHTDGLTNPKVFFWAQGQDPTGTAQSAANDVIYHGGNAGTGAIGVETKPAVYLVYWGPAWAKGFTTPDTNGKLYSSKTLQNYLNSFFKNVGGSAWAGVNSQYCKKAAVGAMNCVGGSGFVTNPTSILKGTWTDSTPVPDDIVALGLAENLSDDPIAQEALRATAHFGYNPNATYIILTPPTTIATGQPYYCGYHTQTTAVDGAGNPERLQYAFIPFLNATWPGLGNTGCGLHNVNAKSDAFGNGVFDGYSIVVGHEFSEAVTDPDNIASFQDGWNDAQTSETMDKCAWTNDKNIMLNGTPYAVQPMWSNAAYDKTGSGCTYSYKR
jgi:hypothetical protein